MLRVSGSLCTRSLHTHTALTRWLTLSLNTHTTRTAHHSPSEKDEEFQWRQERDIGHR